MPGLNPLKTSPVIRDLIALALACAVFYLLSFNMDLFERLYEFTRDHEEWELDEWLPVLIFFGLCMVVFTWRRWQEARRLGNRLAVKNDELNQAMAEIKTLRGIVPICSACKKIRDDKGFWQQVDTYMESRSDLQFSHSMCPDCMEAFYGNQPWFDKVKNKS